MSAADTRLDMEVRRHARAHRLEHAADRAQALAERSTVAIFEARPFVLRNPLFYPEWRAAKMAAATRRIVLARRLYALALETRLGFAEPELLGADLIDDDRGLERCQLCGARIEIDEPCLPDGDHGWSHQGCLAEADTIAASDAREWGYRS